MGFQVKKLKSVTLELFKIKAGIEYYFKFIGPMFVGKEIPAKPEVDSKTGVVSPGKARAPAHLAHVINLETRTEGQIICAHILQKELEAAYPGESYVGKCFAISTQKVEGKNYNLVQIAEIGEPEYDDDDIAEEQAAVAEKPAKGKK